MDEFVATLAAVRDRALDPLLNPDSADAVGDAYMWADVRLSEAEIVGPCVLRFVAAEMRPPQDVKPVGRCASVSIAPPIGKYLQQRLETGDPRCSSVRGLVIEALAHGYFAMIDAEANTEAVKGLRVSVLPDRSAKDLWPYWVTNMNTGRLLKSSVDPGFVQRVTKACGDDFLRGLQDLGLVGWRRGRVGAIGWLYAEAGMLLRFLQTDNFQPGPQTNLVTITNVWPFEDMPVQ